MGEDGRRQPENQGCEEREPHALSFRSSATRQVESDCGKRHAMRQAFAVIALLVGSSAIAPTPPRPIGRAPAPFSLFFFPRPRTRTSKTRLRKPPSPAAGLRRHPPPRRLERDPRAPAV